MISIKPHHFVDIITSLGAGPLDLEPHPYGHAVHVVARKITQDPGVQLKIELGADDICRPCMHNIDSLCDDTIDTSFRPEAPESKRDWNLIIDRRWCERLNIKQNDTFSAREFCERIKVSVENMADIYKEEPSGRTRERQANLQKGIDIFLDTSLQ